MLAPTLALALTVVLDPGHGGSNAGAPARVAGVSEKQVTLELARRVARKLRQAGADVVLTRERDEYLTLRERVRRANQLHPACFVSLHTNASVEHGRRGVETYVLGREAAEVEAVRARRASADPEGATGLLTELAMLEAHKGSLALARALQTRLAAERALSTGSDRGVRQAAYDVLAGLEVPAVLVEVGFLDHPIEGPELLDPEVQERIAGAVAEGILVYARGPRLSDATATATAAVTPTVVSPPTP